MVLNNIIEGYVRYFRALQEFLAQQDFADKIVIQSTKDNCLTGNFEVKIVETGQLIHSAKAGEGKTDSEQAKQAIAVKIEDALEEMG
eukprot:CAMPEP_0184855190 /NCGR_PEP_ID=MMETSP0580-20130426/506_1 /TAXON_ID=1118495 /ORGANISM="Dactyliosolen fragilissimus" /LENGTH=86 /DNA_ID=CAMNT_0027349643 /DNA_START=329 /DNA_END=590 /DNA_ORIENTATION=-